ncbi:MAG: T9SS type A sorting domain-containing protein [Ignavibacteria bacterium]
MKRNVLFTIVLMIILQFTMTIENCFSQWQPEVRLTNDSALSMTFNSAWCIASSGDNVHVVWYDGRDSVGFSTEIYYKRSTDGGINWGTDIRLTNAIYNSSNPSIAVSGQFVHVVWYDTRSGQGQVFYKRSTNGGLNWGPDVVLGSDLGSNYPSIAVSGSSVHVVWNKWQGTSNTEVYYKCSNDGGATWGTDIRLTNNPYESFYPSVAVSGQTVNVAWWDLRDANREIYYKRSSDGGTNWGADTRLTNDPGNSVNVRIAAYGQLVNVVWDEQRDGNEEIYYKRSTDGGLNWGADTRLTNNNDISREPSVTISGTFVHIVWQDDRDNGNSHLYYKRSTDGGVNWGADVRLTNTPARSYNPSISLSGSVVHIVCYDLRGNLGNSEIYYMRNPTGNSVGIKNISTEIPSAFSLSQNYPNPFNNSSKFKFEIAKLGNVKIVVFDLMGREVATLVNESLAPGTYETTFDGSALSSGTYLYKLTSGSFIQTKKLTLIK